MNTPLQKSIASEKFITCTPRPQKETLARLHQTRVGDWAKVCEAARQQGREREALSALHDLSPAEYREQAEDKEAARNVPYRPVSASERRLAWIGRYACSWEAWALLGVIALVLMGMCGMDAAGLGVGR